MAIWKTLFGGLSFELVHVIISASDDAELLSIQLNNRFSKNYIFRFDVLVKSLECFFQNNSTVDLFLSNPGQFSAEI
jgi:hypothetical protein